MPHLQFFSSRVRLRCFFLESIVAHLRRSYSYQICQQVGVAVRGDGKRLQRDYGVETCGMVDLRSYARDCWVDLPCRSLAGMTATALGKTLSKDPAVRFSRWSRAELTLTQVGVHWRGFIRDMMAE